MFISGIENSFLFFLLLWVIFKVGFARTISIMFDRPVILFCMAYSVLFAFSVGLTTANFGALVRYKIPLLPFYVAALYIIYHIGMEKKQENLTDTSLE
jgi:hypothetical protein